MNEFFDFNLNDVVREMYDRVSKENKELKNRDNIKEIKKLENEILSLKVENDELKKKIKEYQYGSYDELIRFFGRIKSAVDDFELWQKNRWC